MSKNNNTKPMRLVTFGNFEWLHWTTVIFLLIAGISMIIIPCILAKKIIIGPIIVGFIITLIGVFCICDHIIFVYKIKKWEQERSDKTIQ